jgi:hypothetical protein
LGEAFGSECNYYAYSGRPSAQVNLPVGATILGIKICDINTTYSYPYNGVIEDIVCVGENNDPTEVSVESCISYFPEMYDTPDSEGCITAPIEMAFFTEGDEDIAVHSPCGLLTTASGINNPEVERYDAEKMGTTKVTFEFDAGEVVPN